MSAYATNVDSGGGGVVYYVGVESINVVETAGYCAAMTSGADWYACEVGSGSAVAAD